MIALVCLIWSVSTAPFKSKSRLKLENAARRRQVVVLQRKVRGRIGFTNWDRLFFILLYRWCRSVLESMVIIRPETVVRWCRAGFRRFSNRPFGVKRFQTMHRCSVYVAHGLVLLFGIGTRPFHHGIRGRGGTIYWAASPSDGRRVQATKRTHLIHRPARDIFPPLGGAQVFSYRN